MRTPGVPSRHQVVVLLLEPLIGYDATIPSAVLGAARSGTDGLPLYSVEMASLDGGPVQTTTGYAVVPHGDSSLLALADTVIVPGTRAPGPRHEGVLDDALERALSQIRPGTRIVSICTGAYVLAAAGLLDGRRATTHWQNTEDFARLFPQVDLDEDVLFVDDGDVLTSAGLSAGVDLCLHLIRRDHGATVANEVARYCVVPPWRDGGQAQFIDRPVPVMDDASTSSTRAWAMAHLDADLSVPDLARRARMSERTFARRFRHETGLTPAAWVTQQRVRHAQHLLETTDLTVDVIATRAGLGTGASLRKHCAATLGVSPQAYRRTFRGATESRIA
ncbi:putative AraC-family transcriptional regulator [Janibacter sp. HTCC2649]|uniref:GlxA family transcriptional regulator n=1 Tax=Janibacter sp. HTCC2649 TaxID=313589 RepID=UPI0000670C44|nr:helix-turn-helix domain-containing protein [Janibacter sp. HTCC2649]EAQ00286.1 putative AraC-family transcriptional regulator [Janibacter sp. HTCC2649]